MSRSVVAALLSFAVLFGLPTRSALAEYDCAKVYKLSTSVIVLLMQYEGSSEQTARNSIWRQLSRIEEQKNHTSDAAFYSKSECDGDTTLREEVSSGMYNYLDYRHGYQANKVQMNAALWLILQATADPTDPQNYDASLGNFTQIPGFTPEFYRNFLVKTVRMYRESHTELDLNDSLLQATHARQKLRYWLPDSDLSP